MLGEMCAKEERRISVKVTEWFRYPER